MHSLGPATKGKKVNGSGVFKNLNKGSKVEEEAEKQTKKKKDQ